MNVESFIKVVENIETDKSLRLFIVGLALSYFDQTSGQWRVFFPKAPDHDFDLIVTETKNGAINRTPYKIQPGSKIEVVTDGKIGDGTYNSGALNGVLNLSELHNERLTLVNDRNQYAGILSLNETSLEIPKDAEPKNLEVWKVEPFPNPEIKRLLKRNYLPVMLAGEFSFEPGAKTEIRIDTRETIQLNHKEDTSYLVVFDNDCHPKDEVCDPFDFRFFYNIIDEGALKTKCRLEVLPVVDRHAVTEHGSCLGGRAEDLNIPPDLI